MSTFTPKTKKINIMKRILGIDTGTNSLGWAVVDKDDAGDYTLVRKGSLIFQEGVKIEKGIESSKASERTGHKALRKHYFRRRLRKIEVLKVLLKYGWCPPFFKQRNQRNGGKASSLGYYGDIG